MIPPLSPHTSRPLMLSDVQNFIIFLSNERLWFRSFQGPKTISYQSPSATPVVLQFRAVSSQVYPALAASCCGPSEAQVVWLPVKVMCPGEIVSRVKAVHVALTCVYRLKFSQSCHTKCVMIGLRVYPPSFCPGGVYTPD